MDEKFGHFIMTSYIASYLYGATLQDTFYVVILSVSQWRSCEDSNDSVCNA